MEYKEIYERFRNIVLKPGNEWKVIVEENKDSKKIVSDFTLPLIGIVTISAFLGYTFRNGFEIEGALKISISAFVSLLAGVYIAYWAMKWLSDQYGIETSQDKIMALVAYSLSISYVIDALTFFFNELIFMKLLVLYSAYVIWESAEILFEINDEKKAPWVFLSSVFIIVSPIFVRIIVSLVI